MDVSSPYSICFPSEMNGFCKLSNCFHSQVEIQGLQSCLQCYMCPTNPAILTLTQCIQKLFSTRKSNINIQNNVPVLTLLFGRHIGIPSFSYCDSKLSFELLLGIRISIVFPHLEKHFSIA